jgi:RND family efflux transporter MFP subunit
MKPLTRNIIIGAAVLLAGGGGAAYFLMPESVDVETVVKGDVNQSITEIGQIEADAPVTVYAPVAGKLSKVSCKINDKIGKGDVLASYDMDDAQNRYEIAQLNLTLQEDGYNAAVETNKKNKSKAYSAGSQAEEMLMGYVHTEENKDSLSIQENERNLRIQQTKQGIQGEISRLQANLEMETKKMEAGESSVENVEKIKNQLTSLYETMAGLPVTETMPTQQFAQSAEYSRQMELMDKRYNDFLTQKNAAEEKIVTESTIKGYEDNVKIAQIQEQSAKKNFDTAQKGVVSTVSGTIMERLVDDGAMPEAGTVLFVVQPDTGYKATLMVSRYDIEYVELGQKAKVTMGQTVYDGTVSAISPVATSSDASGKPKVKVEISFDDKQARPTIGLEASVQIFTKEQKGVLNIPEKAVYTGDSGKYVFVLENGKAQKRTIEAGASGEGYTEILSGLSEGEIVVTQALTDDDEGGRFSPKD